MPIEILTSDPDTLTGPAFTPDTTRVTFNSSDMQNATRWFEGEAEKEVTILLKEIEPTPEENDE